MAQEGTGEVPGDFYPRKVDFWFWIGLQGFELETFLWERVCAQFKGDGIGFGFLEP
jgi:hypothetical protein